MALLTAGTKLTTSCSALAWNPAGMSATDFGTLNELVRNLPQVAGQGGAATTNKKMWVENGRLFVPTERCPQGFQIQPGDYILVDGAGWPFIVPGAIFSTSWQHS